MAISDIRPQEVQEAEVEAPHVAADLQPTAEVWAAVLLTHAAVLHKRSSTAAPMQTVEAASSSSHGWNLQPILSKMKTT